jgi:hypothetical protein
MFWDMLKPIPSLNLAISKQNSSKYGDLGPFYFPYRNLSRIRCPFFLVTKWQNSPAPQKKETLILFTEHSDIFFPTHFFGFSDKKIEVFLVTLEYFLLFWGENIGQFFSIKKFGKNFVSQT